MLREILSYLEDSESTIGTGVMLALGLVVTQLFRSGCLSMSWVVGALTGEVSTILYHVCTVLIGNCICNASLCVCKQILVLTAYYGSLFCTMQKDQLQMLHMVMVTNDILSFIV